MKRAGRKRLSVEIPIELHDELKRISIDRGCTVVVTVCRFLVEKVLEEKKLNETSTDINNRNDSISKLFFY